MKTLEQIQQQMAEDAAAGIQRISLEFVRLAMMPPAFPNMQRYAAFHNRKFYPHMCKDGWLWGACLTVSPRWK